jgi:hypothetical protein
VAVTNESLLVDIKVNTENSAKSVEQLTGRLEELNASLKANNKSAKGTEQAVSGFGAGMVKLAGFITVAKEVYSQFSKVINASIGEYLEAEQSLNKLQTSLALAGDLSDDNVKSFQDFAGTLQETTGVSDDLAISLLASAKNMGLSNDKAKAMVETAADLAAITGKDLESAFQGLAGTLKGQTRGLGEAGIQLRGMSKEALESGKAIEVLGARLKGSAAAAQDTFAGSIRASQQAMSNMLEDLGKVIVESFNLQGANEQMVKTFKALQKLINDNVDSFKALGAGVSWIADKFNTLNAIILGGVVAAFQQFVAVLSVIGSVFARAAAAVGLIDKQKAQDLRDFANAMDQASQVNLGAVKEGVKDLAGFGDKAQIATANGEKFKKKLKEINDASKGMGKVDIGLSDEALKFLEELKKKNAEMASTLAQQEMLQQDRIAEQVRLQKEVLNLKLKELKINGENNDVVQEQLRLLDEQAKVASKGAPSREFEGAQKSFGGDAAKAISGAMSGAIGGAAGAIAGALTGVGAFADAAQAVVDFIPQLLDKITNLLNSITELPNKILDGIKNLAGAIGKIIAELIPNILKAIPQIIETVLKLFEDLPDIFINMLNSLPDLFIKLLDRLPDFVERFVSALIINSPKIAIGIITFMIQNAPRIAMAMMKTFYIELPKAVVKGIIEGAKELIKMLKAFFSGKGIGKNIIDGKQIAAAFKQAGKALTGAASQVFNVSDLQDGLEAAGDPIKNAVDEVTKKLWSWLDELKKIWKMLLDALRKLWLWIWEKILQPIINALREVWLWIYENVITPIIEAIREVWLWVYDYIVKPIIDGLMVVWTWVQTNIVGPIVNGLRAAWQWVYDNILAPIGGVVQRAFQPVIDFFNQIGGAISNAFNSVINFFRSFNIPTPGWLDRLQINTPGWLQDLINAINKLFETPGWIKDVQGALGGGGGGGGGVIGTITGGAKKIGKSLGLAKGGPVYAAEGMMIPKGTDTVPAMLTPGEFVVNKNAVNSLGMGAMHQINSGQAPGGATNVNVSMNITTSEPIDENFVRSKLMPRIKEEMRRASLDGAFLLSGKGIRAT